MNAAGTDEECLDDPITLIDFEQFRFGCFVQNKGIVYNSNFNNCKDSKQITHSENQNLTTNQKFTYVSNSPLNLNLIYECRPVRVKLVDCAKYPWYYRLNKNGSPLINSIDIRIENQEEPDKLSSMSDLDDFICLDPMCMKNNAMNCLIKTRGPDLITRQHVNETKFSDYKNTEASRIYGVNDKHKKANERLAIDLKRNRGLIGMRVRRALLCNDESVQIDDRYRNHESHIKLSVMKDLALSKANDKRYVFDEKLNPMSGQSNSKMRVRQALLYSDEPVQIDDRNRNYESHINLSVMKDSALSKANDKRYVFDEKINHMSSQLNSNMRVQRSLLYKDEPVQIDDRNRNHESHINLSVMKDSALSKANDKRYVFDEKNNHMRGQSNSKMKECRVQSKEVTLTNQEYNKNICIRNLPKNASPVLSINVESKGLKLHYSNEIINKNLLGPISKAIAYNGRENSLFNGDFNQSCKRGEVVLNDSILRDVKNAINKCKHNHDLTVIPNKSIILQSLASGSKSPVPSCKRNVKLKTSEKLSQKTTSSNYKDSTNNKCIKSNLNNFNNTNEKIKLVKDKQKQCLRKSEKNMIKELKCHFFKQKNKEKIKSLPVKLNNIVENLYKNKLKQIDDSGNHQIRISKEIVPEVKTTCNFRDVEELKNVRQNINHKEKISNSNLTFQSANKTEYYNLQARTAQSQHVLPDQFNFNFNKVTNVPVNLTCQSPLLASLTSRFTVRHQKPRSHLRISPVSSVLLNSIKTKGTFPFAHAQHNTCQTLLEKNKTNASNQNATNLATYPRTTSRTTFNEYNSGNIPQNNVRRLKRDNGNEKLKQTNRRMGYSPPILPIPTYEATFEYLSNVISKNELDSMPLDANGKDDRVEMDHLLSDYKKWHEPYTKGK